jgi:hypothetical protein
MSAYRHGQNGTIRRADPDGTTWDIPPDPENADYQRYLADVEAGAEVMPADPLPEPEPGQPERFSELVAALTPALQSATTLDQVKAVVGQAFSGLDEIYGSGRA